MLLWLYVTSKASQKRVQLTKSHPSSTGVLKCVPIPSWHLTLADGQVFMVCKRCDEEACLGHWVPVVQHSDSPHAGPQWCVQRRPVVCELGSGVNQDIVGGSNHVSWVNPHHRDGHIGPFGPLLHPHRLIQGPHEITKIAEDSFLSIPVCPNLMEKRNDVNGF